MDTRKMKLALSAGALALSLALAGCGGSSSSGPPGKTPEQIAMEEAAERLTKAVNDAIADARTALRNLDKDSDQAAIEAAEKKVDAVDDAIEAAADADVEDTSGWMTTLADLKQAHMNAADLVTATTDDRDAMTRRMTEKKVVDDAITAAEKAVNGLSEASTDDDITEAKNKVEAIQTAVEAGANLTQADIIAYNSKQGTLNTAIETAEGEVAARIKRENDARMAMNKEVATKAKAIMVEADQTTDAGLGGSAATATDNNEGAYNLAIKRDRMATMVTVTVEGATDADDEKFVKAADVAFSAKGHHGQTQTRMMDADEDGNVVKEIAIVATDITAPKAVAFAKFENADGDLTQPLDVRHQTGTETTNATNNPNNAYGLVANFDPSLVMSASFVRVPDTVGETLTFKADVADTEDKDESARVSGTYNGAQGTYKCAGNTDCTVTFDAMGKISELHTGWVFIPNEGATSNQPDYDYLHYGFWLKKTTDEDGATTYNEVQTFAGHSMAASTGSEIDDVKGKATYTGGATGAYVHNVHTAGGGQIHSSSAGHFTADAMLTAYFGGTSIAEDDHNMVTGTISNFMLSGEESNDWSVALKGTRAASANTFTGTANGGGAEGSFSGMYYGVTPDTPAADDDDAKVAPGSVVGEFNAGFSNGAVAGAFGARKQ